MVAIQPIGHDGDVVAFVGGHALISDRLAGDAFEMIGADHRETLAKVNLYVST